jgi:hypothetical protein
MMTALIRQNNKFWRLIMKKTIKMLVGATIAFASISTGAHAEIRDRQIAASSSAQVLFAQIVVTATSMCNEAASQGEVFNIGQCVDVVVARTVEELNRPTLTAYALLARPAIASV